MLVNTQNINFIVTAVLFGIGALIALYFFVRRAEGVKLCRHCCTCQCCPKRRRPRRTAGGARHVPNPAAAAAKAKARIPYKPPSLPTGSSAAAAAVPGGAAVLVAAPAPAPVAAAAVESDVNAGGGDTRSNAVAAAIARTDDSESDDDDGDDLEDDDSTTMGAASAVAATDADGAAAVRLRVGISRGGSRRHGTDYSKKPPLSSYISGFVLLSFSIRCWWFVAKATMNFETFGERIVVFAMNRMSLVSLFTGFSLIVMDWANVWSLAHGSDPRQPYYFCMLLNGLCIVSQIFSCMSTLIDPDLLAYHSTSLYYSVDAFVIALWFLLLSISFFVYGERLRHFLTTFVESSPLGTGRTDTERSVSRVSWVTTCCTICFSMRFLFFGLGCLTWNHSVVTLPTLFDDITYPLCYYTIPDLIPGIAILFIMRGRHNQPGAAGMQSPPTNDDPSDPVHSSGQHAFVSPLLPQVRGGGAGLPGGVNPSSGGSEVASFTSMPASINNSPPDRAHIHFDT